MSLNNNLTKKYYVSHQQLHKYVPQMLCEAYQSEFFFDESDFTHFFFEGHKS